MLCLEKSGRTAWIPGKDKYGRREDYLEETK